MIKVKIFTIGRLKESWLSMALSEYEQRLTPFCQIEWLLLKNDLDLVAAVMKGGPFIALDAKGELLESRSLSLRLAHSLRLSFVIGGAEGIPPILLQKASWLWSLSLLTFPHQIVRLLLMEQLYRAITIQLGTPYHK